VRKIPDLPQAEITSADGTGAKQAIAQVTRLIVAEGLSLLLVQLETGRMHQIRIQASARGFPVVGDAPYGAQRTWLCNLGTSNEGLSEGEPVSENATASAQSPAHPPVALHAYSLQFRHPQTANQSSKLPRSLTIGSNCPRSCWRTP